MTETCRKTYKYQLIPTPEQAEKLDWTLWRCRELYNAALGERKEAWRMRQVSINYFQQKRDLPAIKEVRPEYQDNHAHVLQDVIRRLDKAYQAFFRRLANGEKPGFPRFKGRNRYRSLVWQWGEVRRWYSLAQQDWSYPDSFASPIGGHPKDGDDLQRG